MQMGIKPMRLTTRAFTRLCYSMVIDDLTSGMVSRYEARDAVDKWLEEFTLPRSRRTDQNPTRKLPDRETWGLLPEHQEGLRKAMAIFDPSAGGAPPA